MLTEDEYNAEVNAFINEPTLYLKCILFLSKCLHLPNTMPTIIKVLLTYQNDDM